MNKKFKSLLLISGAIFMSTAVINTVSLTNNASVFRAADDESFETLETEWFTIKADAHEEKDNIPAKAELEIYFSPVFMDYENANSESLKQLLNKDTGLIGAIKYILASQVKFIQPVEPETPREVDESIESTYDATNRNELFDQFVKAAFNLTSDGQIKPGQDNKDEFEEEFEKFQIIMDAAKEEISELRDGQIPTGGNFLRTILAYIAGRKVNDTAPTLSELQGLLGVDASGNYIGGTNTGLYNALKYIYDAEDSSTDFNATIESDIEKIYEDAKDIVLDYKSETLVLMEACLLLQETTIPMKTVIDILGVETVKEAIFDCFKCDDGSVTPETVRYMLETFTKDTIYQLCEIVGFTKEEIKQTIKEMTNERLMEITKDMSSYGMDNVRIVLGMANDNLEQDKAPSRKVTRAVEQDHYVFPGQYESFGDDLVEIVLGRMTITDMINAVEAVWVRNPDEDASENHLLYSYNYDEDMTDDVDLTSDGRRLYLRNLLDWMSTDLPTMEEISTRLDGEHKQTYRFEVKTPLNQENVWVNLTLGFQNKDTHPIRDLAKALDDAFDLTYSFVEGENQDYSRNTLEFELKARPQYLTNAYEYLYNSGFIKNSDDNRLKEKLFELTYMKFGDMKQYIDSLLAEDMIKDLKNLDYEEVLDSLIHIEKLKDIFRNTPATQEDINRFIKNLRAFAEMGDRISYDSIYNVVNDQISASLANKLNQQEFKDLLNDINNWTHEMADNNLSFEVLEQVNNELTYQYVDLLNDKIDTVKRFKKVIYRIVNAIPVEFDNCSIMDFYNEADNTFVFDQDFALDWKKILLILPLGTEIERILNEVLIRDEDKLCFLSPDVVVNPNANLNADSKQVHRVIYNYFDGEEDVQLIGMLLEGAELIEFAPIEINGEFVKNWKRIDGEHNGEDIIYMPDENIELGPVFYNTLDFSTAQWTYAGEPLPNTGDVQSIKLASGTYPEGEGTIYEIKYTDNEKVNGGTYTATAEIVLLEGYEDVIITGYPAPQVWTILDKSETWFFDFKSLEDSGDGYAIAYVHINDGIVDNASLHAVQNDEAFKDDDVNFEECFVENSEIFSAYEFSFEFNNLPYILNGYNGTVTALIPEDIRDKDFVIITLDDEGNVEYIKSDSYSILNDYVKFDVSNISKYGFVIQSEPTHESDAGIIVLLIVTGLFNLLLAAYLIFLANFDKIKKAREEKIKVSTKTVVEEKIVVGEDGKKKKVIVTKTIKKTQKGD